MSAEPRTIDMTQPAWGRNLSVKTTDGGQTLRGFMWTTPKPRDGDYVIVATENPAKPTSRYMLETAVWNSGVDDMYSVALRFAPREAVHPAPC